MLSLHRKNKKLEVTFSRVDAHSVWVQVYYHRSLDLSCAHCAGQWHEQCQQPTGGLLPGLNKTLSFLIFLNVIMIYLIISKLFI